MMTASIPDPTIGQYIVLFALLACPAIPAFIKVIGEIRGYAREVAERKAKANRPLSPANTTSQGISAGF